MFQLRSKQYSWTCFYRKQELQLLDCGKVHCSTPYIVHCRIVFLAVFRPQGVVVVWLAPCASSNKFSMYMHKQYTHLILLFRALKACSITALGYTTTAKVLVTGANLRGATCCNPSQNSWYVLFRDVHEQSTIQLVGKATKQITALATSVTSKDVCHSNDFTTNQIIDLNMLYYQSLKK